jgi:hypothetical protein
MWYWKKFEISNAQAYVDTMSIIVGWWGAWDDCHLIFPKKQDKSCDFSLQTWSG